MKNIVRIFISCLALAVGLSGCYDEMDDKAVIDAKYENANKPTVTLSNVKVIDFSNVEASGSVSTIENILESGFMYAVDESFNNAVCVANEEITESFNATLSDLSENTTYYIRSYAVTAGAGIAVSEHQTVTTPKAPVFTADVLDGKRYTANVTSYFDEASAFDFTLSLDPEDPHKIWFNNLSNYFFTNGVTAEKGCNKFYGMLDVESMTITIPQEQPMGYKSVVLLGFSDVDPDTAEDYSDVTVSIVNFGSQLVFKNAFGFYEGGFYELFYGDLTVSSK